MINTTRFLKLIRNLILIVINMMHCGITAMHHQTIKPSLSLIPDHQIIIDSKSITGNTVDHVQLQFHNKTNNQYFVKQYEGKELEQLVSETTKSYPGDTLENALSQKLQESLSFADLGNPKPLIELLDPNRNNRLQEQFGISSKETDLEETSHTNEPVILISQTPDQIRTETVQLIANIKHRKEYNYARNRFEQNAIANNAKVLINFQTLAKSIRNLRSNDTTYQELSLGIKLAGTLVKAVYQNPTIKNLLALYNAKLFENGQSSTSQNLRDKQNVEAQWTCFKQEVVHEHIKIKNEIVEHYSASDNVKEILAYDIVSFIKSCDPENFPQFCLEVYQIPGFKGVFDHYKTISQGNWFTNSIYSLKTLPKNAFNGVLKNTINPSPKFPTYEHFKHLGTIDTLCREGKIEQAQQLANPSIPIEQELITEHFKVSNGMNTLQEPTAITSKQEIVTPNEMPLIDSISIALAKESFNSNFPVNPYAISVMRNYYDQDIKEITDFVPTNFKQLVAHDHLVTTINNQAQRVYNANNVAEQAVALHVIDAYLKAYELNKQDKLNLISEFLQQFEKQVDNAYVEIGTQFLSRLSQNIQHPIEYIREQVTGLLHIAYFIADASLGQFFRTTEQNNQFSNNLAKFINEFDKPLLDATSKDLQRGAGTFLADIAFDAGISCLAKLGAKITAQQLPKMATKALDSFEKINMVAQGEKQDIAVTPGGIQVALKREINTPTQVIPVSAANKIIKTIPVTNGIIREFNITQKMMDHIFSSQHIKDGILLLGKTPDEIIDTFAEIIIKYNASGRLIEETNNIETIINGFKATIRVHIQDGKVINLDGFRGFSNRPTVRNLIID